MTIQQIVERFEALIDDSIDTRNVLNWCNDLQNELSNDTYFPTRITLIKDDTGFKIPDNFNGELIILTELEEGSKYSVYDDYIHFTDEDSYTELEIQYNKLLDDFTELTDTPELKSNLHTIYVYYCCLMYCQTEEEFDRYTFFEKEYSKAYRNLRKYFSKLRPKPSSWVVER